MNFDNFTNFNTSMVPNLGDILTEVNLNNVLDGTLLVLSVLLVLCVSLSPYSTQAIVLNVQLFVFNVYRDVEVVWPALLM